MLKPRQANQIQLEYVSIEGLVPDNHLLRKIDGTIDFEFIRDKVRALYCSNNGRPAIDPVILFKMLFIGYLFGIRSERQLVRDIQVNVAYRWFLGMSLTDKVPDASTLSQNRRRRFLDSTIYQDIFDEIVLQAINSKLVDGKTIYTDSTHLKASANKHKFEKKAVRRSTCTYFDDLNKDINKDREDHGKKPLKAKTKEPIVKETKISTTDPDSGYMVREGKPKGFFYLDHRSVDNKNTIITDCHVTPASVHDSIPYLERLDYQRRRFGFKVETVGLDAGYFTASICKGLEDRDIFGVIGYRRPNHKKGFIPKRKYLYESGNDCHYCPGGKILAYHTTTRQGYRLYRSNPKQCIECSLLDQCTQSANKTKVITRHVWEESKERINQHRLTDYGKAIYKRRKETVERTFADSKQLHGHRYARRRGLKKVQEQALLCAACQNMKKIALILTKQTQKPHFRLFYSVINRYAIHINVIKMKIIQYTINPYQYSLASLFTQKTNPNLNRWGLSAI